MGGLSHAKCAAAEPTLGCGAAEPDLGLGLRRFLDAAETAAERERRQAILPLLGRPDTDNLARAIARLQAVLARHPEQAAVWNDYSVVLLLRRRGGGGGFDLFQGLEAIETAVALNPTSAEARFNQALILEEVGLRSVALAAWAAAAELESDAGWRAEIETRRRSLVHRPPLDELWQQESAAPSEARLAKVESIVDQFPWRSHRWLVEALLPQLATATLEAKEPPALREGVERLAAGLAELGDPFGLDVLAAWPSADDRAHLEAVIALGEGLRHLEELEVESGRRVLEEALPVLRARSDPLALSAAMGLVVADYFNDTRAALAGVNRLTAGPASLYSAILGRAHWLHGTLLGRDGDYVGSRLAYGRALATLEPVYGLHPAGFIRTLVGEVATLDGRLEESWEASAQGLPQTLAGGTRRRIHSALATVGSVLRESGLDYAARRVYIEALANAEHWGSAYGRAAALRGLAGAERRLGDEASARATIELAQSATASITDPVMRELTQAGLVTEEAELLLGERGRSVALENSSVDLEVQHAALVEAIETYRRLGWSFDEVQSQLALAGLLSAAGRSGSAPLKRAGELLVNVRPAPIDRPGTVGTGLAQTVASRQALDLLRGDDIAGALLVAERSRLLGSGMGPGPPADLIRRLNALAANTDSVLILLLGGLEPVGWVLSPSGLRVYQPTIGSKVVRRRARELQAATTRERQELLNELAAAVLPADLQLARRYVFVVDPDFAAIPFAALPHPSSGEALVATSSVGRAPALSLLLPAEREAGSGPPLVVFAPMSASAKELPATREEATHVASRLEDAVLLESPRRGTLLRHLEKARVFHFSGHLRADPLAPYRQHLLLDAVGATLASNAILGLDLSFLELVVLSSCDSAAAGTGRLDGPSYADAFLLAGAHEVVGTLWPVDDQSSLELMEHFWNGVGQGLNPLDALAEAARAARARDPWGTVDSPPVWMAYRIEGSIL